MSFILDTNTTCRGYFMRVSFSSPSLKHCWHPKQAEDRDTRFFLSSLHTSSSVFSFLAAGRQLTVPGRLWLGHQLMKWGEKVLVKVPANRGYELFLMGLSLLSLPQPITVARSSCQPLFSWVRGCAISWLRWRTPSGWATWCECVSVERHVEDS